MVRTTLDSLKEPALFYEAAGFGASGTGTLDQAQEDDSESASSPHRTPANKNVKRTADDESTSKSDKEREPSQRKRTANKRAKVTVDIESVSEGDSECEPARRKRKRKARPRKIPPPLYKASVKELAETGTIKVTGSTADIDNAIIVRIRKCLERANHPSTPEAEAKAALHLASRLMGQYNVSQAEILAHETPDAQRQYAGQSIVSIQRVDCNGSKPVLHHGYLDALVAAMNGFFDCKAYSAVFRSSLEWTFYGIAENTVAAAMAFEMAYNLIAEWARPHKGVGGKNSYCLGISQELKRMSIETKAAEEEEVKKMERDAIATKVTQEKAERQAQLDRLASLSPSPTERPSYEPGVRVAHHGNADNPIWLDSESDGEENFDNDLDTGDQNPEESDEDCFEPDFKVIGERSVNPFGDLDEEINKLIKIEDSSPEPTPFSHSSAHPAPSTQGDSPPRKDSGVGSSAGTMQDESGPTETETGLEVKWTSHVQLVQFRETATKIAEDYLKDQGIKLGRGSVRSSVIRDREAYDRGVRDAKKIDVHRKKIKE